jgi:hypothetical protein
MANKQPVFTCVEYVWTDFWGVTRSKCKVVHGKAGITLKVSGLDLFLWFFSIYKKLNIEKKKKTNSHKNL